MGPCALWPVWHRVTREKGERGPTRLLVLGVRKVKNSQARTGHQRGMDGRETDDDDTPSDTQTQSSALHLFPAKAKRGVWWQASPSFWECSLLVLALVLAHETERKKRCDHFAMV